MARPLLPLPNEIKLLLLEATAASNLDSLYSLGDVDDEFRELVSIHEQRLLLVAIQVDLGVRGNPDYTCALAVVKIIRACDTLPRGLSNMHVNSWAIQICEDALKRFPGVSAILDRRTAELAIRIRTTRCRPMGKYCANADCNLRTRTYTMLICCCLSLPMSFSHDLTDLFGSTVCESLMRRNDYLDLFKHSDIDTNYRCMEMRREFKGMATWSMMLRYYGERVFGP